MRYMNSNVATTQTNNVKVYMLRLPGCLCPVSYIKKVVCLLTPGSYLRFVSYLQTVPLEYQGKGSRLFKPQLRHPNYSFTLYS